MTIEMVKAISYITEVATLELSILQWIKILNSVYPNGIPEEAKLSDAITYWVERFPNFEERSKNDSQESYDKLFEDFIYYIENELQKIS